MPGIKRKAGGEASSRAAKVARVNELVSGLSEGQAALNNVAHLLDLAREPAKGAAANDEDGGAGEAVDPEVLQVARTSLYKVFKRLVALGQLSKAAGGAESGDTSASTVSTWLRERYVEFGKILLDGLRRPSSAHQLTCVTICLRLLRDDPLTPTPGSFSVDPYNRLVGALLRARHLTPYTKSTFRQDHLEKFADLRFHFYRAVAKTCDDVRAKYAADKSVKTRRQMETVRDNALELLSAIVTLPEKELEDAKLWVATEATSTDLADDKKPNPLSLVSQRKSLSEAWLSVLRLPLSIEQYKQVLNIMHKRIIPFMSKPALLMDFLTSAYGSGGIVSLLSLNGLFFLIQKHRLDYPGFFPQLYALCTEQTMHSRHRARFFRSLAQFLDSSAASAALLAAFLKRLGRLCLTAPPAAVVAVLPLTYNLLRKHPSLMQLIHRPSASAAKPETATADAVTTGSTDAVSVPVASDAYDAECADPEAANALSSSLWELASLESHYHPSVATLARLLGEPFTKQPYAMEDFLDHAYATMTDAELKARGAMKKQVPRATVPPEGLWGF